MKCKELFRLLYAARNEQQVTDIIESHSDIFSDDNNWKPLGGSYGNIGTVETQQSNATAALVEKITNSIDAILMKKCLESGIDPRSTLAPRSVEVAVAQFFPEKRDWDLSRAQKVASA